MAYVPNDIRVIKSAGGGCIRMFAKGDYCLPKFSGIVGPMTTNLDWERLGRFVRSARGARAQADIAANGGPSDETLSKIEQGRWRPTRSVQRTLEKLELGLGWAPGSANAVLAGGEPTRLHGDEPPAAAPSDPQPSSHVPEFLPAARATWEAVNELASSPEGDPLREWKGQRAVVTTADTLTDALLRLNAGPAAKSLIQEMGYSAHELMKDQIFAIRKNKEGDTDDMEAAAQPDAQAEGHQDQEVELAGDEEVVRLPSSAESPPQSRRSETAEAIHDRFRRATRARSRDGGENPPSLGK
ncbi:immunity repressor [Mycobacterium phage LilSpotty]|uniref:Immunity repressor n=1 Tax=Mycobacterium phage LilSpotty TaxID=2588512 RepID=A0A4Y6ENX5_9CAUD|nr:immunity repressor [Mycobacterium phage LilSpotty]QDF19775.1 immunity repressor [Mycobacterium phage LilSpotty]